MLSKTEMVRTRMVLESMYTDTCTITEHQKVQKVNKSMGFQEVVVAQDQPCRLSSQTVNSTSRTDTGASALTQTIKLFLSPDVQVKPGSKLTVTRDFISTEYQNSGEPARYETHQEIILELFKGWS